MTAGQTVQSIKEGKDFYGKHAFQQQDTCMFAVVCCRTPVRSSLCSTEPCKMADMLPALEVAFVDRFWEWDDGKGLPANPRWCPLSKVQQKDIHEENHSLTLLPDNRTFQKVAEYDSGIMLFHSEGMWNVESWSYVRALVRPIGPDLLLSVRADHMPTEQCLK